MARSRGRGRRAADHVRKYRRRYLAGFFALVILGGAGVYLGTDQAHTPFTPSDGAVVLLDLQAPRDLGRLPARSGWCTIARTAEHCYLLQETSGTATDVGSAANWHMAPSGSPRRGALTSLPVQDASGWVDITSELALGADGAGSVIDDTVTSNDASRLVSVTVVYRTRGNTGGRLVDKSLASPGWTLLNKGGGVGELVLLSRDSAGVKQITTVTAWGDNAWHCATGVIDSRTANAGKIYVDGNDETPAGNNLEAALGWGDHATAIGAKTNGGQALDGAVARVRIDYAVITLVQHQAFCGTLWQPPSTNTHALTKLAPADVSWTQTGGTRCYAASADTSICVPGGLPGYAFSAALNSIGWPVEPDRTNRVLDSRDLSTGSWAGGIDAAAVAPDGSKTAATVSVTDASTLSQVVTGYSASATLNLRVWAKCSTGTLKFSTDGASAGSWDVACATVAGAWTELHSTHAAVTEGAAWMAASTGDATLIVTSDATGVTADLWTPTLTDAAGLSVIPTAGAAVATGSIAWQVDNDPAVYYKGAAGKITLVGDWISGACFDVADATDIGRQFGDAIDWFAFDAIGVTAFRCDMPLAGADTAVIRWDSANVVDPGLFAECLLNTVTQTWDSTPISSWTPATPGTIKLDGFGSTSCTAVIQTVKIEDAP